MPHISDALTRILFGIAVLAACTPSEPSDPVAPSIDTDTETETENDAAPVLVGQLSAHDGSPLKAAHLTMTRSGFRTGVADLELPADGRLRVELPGPGVYSMRLAGVDHAERRVSFAVAGGTVELDARLGTYAHSLGDEGVTVRVRYLDADGKAGEAHDGVVEPVQAGARVYAVPLAPPPGATAVQYQLVTTSGRSFNGPAAQRWVYDGGGDFWSERDLTGDTSFEIALDELAPAGQSSQLELHGEQVVGSLADEGRAVLDETLAQLRQALAAAKDADAVCATVRPLAASAREQVEALDDAQLRAHAALAWGTLFGQVAGLESACLTPADLYWLLDLVPADHIAWSFLGLQIDSVFGAMLDDPKSGEYRRQLQTVQTDPGLRAHLLYLDLRQAGDDEAVTGPLYAELVRDYGDSYSALWARSDYDPNRPLQLGRTMPDWSFEDFAGQAVRAEDLRGRPYLIDVWATWCGPCVSEMQHLHTAWETLGGADGPIAFVSVSVDAQVDTVEAFRRDKWPMPWINLHEPDESALQKAWEFSGVPLVVLVDAEGRIAATEEKLRGEALLETLQAYVTKP
ncbi:Thioredoxin [Enhygromyxa salina]|uniref:Thioredoxin n=1 Tax=Enhygromyxa salina TaxID=215803 RepID=A0A0C2D8N4_9BACT|nr:TlpA disulfide reductase family protein [Enhygromyxa salina]KIG17985.1 Thioredoxin [Enhygromyxa salina]